MTSSYFLLNRFNHLLADFRVLWCWVVHHCVSHRHYRVTSCWASRLPPCPSYCDQGSNDWRWAALPVTPLGTFGHMPRSAIAESYGSGIFSFLKNSRLIFQSFVPFFTRMTVFLLQASLWILNMLPLSINNIFTYKDAYNIFTYNISTYTVTHFFSGFIIMYPTWTKCYLLTCEQGIFFIL